MTRDEIMKMEPGRELDKLVGEFMGYEYVPYQLNGRYVGKDYFINKDGEPLYDWSPSTDIAAAWEVWEHNRPRNWRFTLTWTNGKYLALIIAETEKGHKTLAQVEAYSAAEAMVKCRLLAVMGE